MMAGAISLATLLIEAAIVYSSTVLLNISTRNSGCQFGALVFYLSFKIFRSTPFMFMIPTSFTEFWADNGTGLLNIITAFLAGLLLIISLLVFRMFLIDGNSELIPELTKLVLACLIGIGLMIANWNKMKPIDIKRDKIIFTIPLLFQVYNLVIGFGLQLKQAYIPLTVCTVIEVCYFGYLYHKGKRSARLSFTNN